MCEGSFLIFWSLKCEHSEYFFSCYYFKLINLCLYDLQMSWLFLIHTTFIRSSACKMISNLRYRSYHDESTRSLQNSEVKHHRAQLVLSWGTTWESFECWFLDFFVSKSGSLSIRGWFIRHILIVLLRIQSPLIYWLFNCTQTPLGLLLKHIEQLGLNLSRSQD